MTNDSVLEIIKESLVNRGFELIVDDVARGPEAFAPDTFAIRSTSGEAYSVHVEPMQA